MKFDTCSKKINIADANVIQYTIVNEAQTYITHDKNSHITLPSHWCALHLLFVLCFIFVMPSLSFMHLLVSKLY
jgi:hypothetical protein